MCVYRCPHFAEGARGGHEFAERKDGGGASVHKYILYIRVYVYMRISSVFVRVNSSTSICRALAQRDRVRIGIHAFILYLLDVNP